VVCEVVDRRVAGGAELAVPGGSKASEPVRRARASPPSISSFRAGGDGAGGSRHHRHRARSRASGALDRRRREDSERGRRVGRRGFCELPLHQGALLARALGGSLEWLAAQTAGPGEPAEADIRLDPDALRARAKQLGVKLEALRLQAKLDVSGWRAVTGGKREPTLGQVAAWAKALRCDERPAAGPAVAHSPCATRASR
jgi:hypothetical protein